MSLTHLWNREAITELLSQITEVFILVEGQCQKFCTAKEPSPRFLAEGLPVSNLK